MSRSRSAFRQSALLLCVVALTACGTADPAKTANAAAEPGRTAEVAASPLLQTTAISGPGAAGDTLADSITIQRADRGRLMGREDAMWVVMISDFQCPYCKQWHDSSMANLKRDYIDAGKIRLAYLHLPLSIHRHAKAQAEASMCAAVQAKFWEYADVLFREQRAFQPIDNPSAKLDDIGRELKLDMPSFTRCRKSDAIRMLVENDERQATQARVQSTPSFLIGEFLVQGALPYKDFRRAIDTALVVAKSRRTR
ncbi:DsbA family protein [Gemmatimonas groenlandica]|uniref:Thioredoxin domain-containing protein n=1 Tax=Gemmatimonas groenlandica TaxID=2732249 RepID=A0A6M4ITA5_9BACT|nr:thioredoxin domain-containing protein [Gemmatimonas groenlandica]QJR36052.1 thioredoxin domain-containing protein [Gemmatimonas groenlandica]